MCQSNFIGFHWISVPYLVIRISVPIYHIVPERKKMMSVPAGVINTPVIDGNRVVRLLYLGHYVTTELMSR